MKSKKRNRNSISFFLLIAGFLLFSLHDAHSGIHFDHKGEEQFELKEDGSLTGATIYQISRSTPSENALIFDYNGEIKLWAENDKTIHISEEFIQGASGLPNTGLIFENPFSIQVAEIIPQGNFYISNSLKNIHSAISYIGNSVIFEYDKNNETHELVYQNIVTPEGVDGKLDFETQSITYYIKDHLGSTREALKENGDHVLAINYYSYGTQKEMFRSSEDIRETFTGKEFDNGAAGIRLYYFGARYLDPEIGIWSSVDPKGQFWSPYSYCGNNVNPVKIVDPDGEAVKITITDKVVGWTWINRFTGKVARNLGYNYQVPVFVYRVDAINEYGSKAIFHFTRDAITGRGAFLNTGLFRADFRTEYNPNRLELRDLGDVKSNTIPGRYYKTRSGVQSHELGASGACNMLVPFNKLTSKAELNFFNSTIRQMLFQDAMTNRGFGRFSWAMDPAGKLNISYEQIGSESIGIMDIFVQVDPFMPQYYRTNDYIYDVNFGVFWPANEVPSYSNINYYYDFNFDFNFEQMFYDYYYDYLWGDY